jgi:hypothetical protein
MMRIFGEEKASTVEWAQNGDSHLLVLCVGAAWELFCRSDEKQWTTPEVDMLRDKKGKLIEPNRKDLPVLFKHDITKVTCANCIADLAAMSGIKS